MGGQEEGQGMGIGAAHFLGLFSLLQDVKRG
jgi:hypothetical protein